MVRSNPSASSVSTTGADIVFSEIAAKAAVGTGTGAGADEDDFMVLKRRTKQVEKEENQEDRWNAVADASTKAPGRLKRDDVSLASAELDLNEVRMSLRIK